MKDIVTVMIKLADEENSSIEGKKILKTMSSRDQENMAKAIAQCGTILERIGIPASKQFLSTLNAGHPGGMLPLSAADKDTLPPSVLPDNLYVADGTILPGSMGNPPILTIMTLAEKITGLL